jgi:nuclear pore complex protein Nup205
MLDIPDIINYESLSTPQRQALVENALRKWQEEARTTAHILFRKYATTYASPTLTCVVL